MSDTEFNLFTLPPKTSDARDFYSGQRSQNEDWGAQVDVDHADEGATYPARAAHIVNTVIAQTAYRAKVNATLQLIKQQKEPMAMGNVQAQANTVLYSTVLSLRSQLASHEATIYKLAQHFTQSVHLLAALTRHVRAERSAAEHPQGRSRCPSRQRQYRSLRCGDADKSLRSPAVSKLPSG